MLTKLKQNKILLILGTLVLLYALWWGYSTYKTFYYQPSFRKQEKMVKNFVAFLQDEGIDTANVKVERLIYDGKADTYIYIVKISGEPYTYECYFALNLNDKQDKKQELYCDIKEIAEGKIYVLPENEEPKEGATEKDFEEYDKKYYEAYKKLVKGLLLEKYLVPEVSNAVLEIPTVTEIHNKNTTQMNESVHNEPKHNETTHNGKSDYKTISFVFRNIYSPNITTKYTTKIPENCKLVFNNEPVDPDRIFSTEQLQVICGKKTIMSFKQAPEDMTSKLDSADLIMTKYIKPVYRVELEQNSKKVFMYSSRVETKQSCKIFNATNGDFIQAEPPCGSKSISTSPNNGLFVTCFAKNKNDATLKMCDDIIINLRIKEYVK